MSTITTINATDQITNSRTVINTNFSNLNTDKIETSVLDTDTTLAADSDSKVSTQKAVKAYIDSRGSITTGLQKTLVAGGTINGATTPVPVYQNKTDNKVYPCDANDLTALKFMGFAVTNAVNGGDITVKLAGLVSGFTALDEGEKYFVQDAVGTIGTSIGTYEVLVGVAVSTTEMVIQKGLRYGAGNTGAMGTASGSSAVSCGFRPSRIALHARAVSQAAATIVALLDAVWVNGVLKSVTCVNGATTEGLANSNARLYDPGNSAQYMEFTITSVTDTGFTITWTETGTFSVDQSECLWEAEGAQ